jgi:peptide/nickel transport system substrate-binding protein
MRSLFRCIFIPFFLCILTLFLAACADEEEVVIPITVQPQPSPTATVMIPTEPPPPPKMLVVCLNAEPDSLYLYGGTSPEVDTIFQALYDGPVDVRTYRYEPVILSKLPRLEDGDVRIEPVSVWEGQRYMNPLTLLPDTLGAGKTYLPSGCSNMDCAQSYSEGEVLMDQMTVEFELLPGITWSDGEPLKASDSVYSFGLDADEATPTTKYVVQRTSDYIALDELHTQWIGIPGFLDVEFEANFWSPLPEHILGEYSPSELLQTEAAVHYPIGWGAYEIERWDPGAEIIMKRSQSYFRAGEGLPYFDFLRFRFLGNDTLAAFQQLLTGECDILDETLLPASLWLQAFEMAQADRIKLDAIPGSVMERIDFNLLQGSGTGVASLFADVRTRQAIAACIDRPAMVKEIFSDMTVVPDSYLPPSHPWHQEPEAPGALSVEQAQAQLESVGWVDGDDNPATARIARGIPGIPEGTALSFRLLTLQDSSQEAVAERIRTDLARCGIDLQVEYGDARELFTPWPNGPIFGGRFDTVGWAWPILVSPPCEMFAGFEIPSADYIYGINASGFNDPSYDQACRRVLLSPFPREHFEEAIGQTELIFRSQLPAIPLYMRPRWIAYGNDVCGIRLDPTTYSILWNLEEIAAGEGCSE